VTAEQLSGNLAQLKAALGGSIAAAASRRQQEKRHSVASRGISKLCTQQASEKQKAKAKISRHSCGEISICVHSGSCASKWHRKHRHL